MTVEPNAGPAASGTDTSTPVFAVEGLSVEFGPPTEPLRAVDDVSFEVGPHETVGLVGESGSGKTVSCLAALGLIGGMGGRRVAGSVRLAGRELTTLPERELRRIRGQDIGMIFQQPIRSLNPGFTVGEHIAETVRVHRGASRKEAWRRAVDLLDRVHIPDAARRARDYPHQFSGGMCQRVMIAVALACDPRLLIADEPTTALDTTVQARILALLAEIRAETGISVILISHDLGVVAETCDRVVVLYAGQVVEQAPVAELFSTPHHPYTEGLMRAIPRPGSGRTLLGIPGRVPAAGSAPQDCRFHPRCRHYVTGICDSPPTLQPASAVASARCHRVGDLKLTGVLGA